MSEKTQLDRIEAQVNAIARHLGIGAAQPASSAPAGPAPAAAAADLDGPHGDPIVKKDPKRWTGSSFVGSRFSACPAEYLDVVASFEDWRAAKDDEAGAKGEKNAKGYPKDGRFARLDAARARGWAARVRAGLGRAPSADDGPPDDFGYGDPKGEDLPF